MSATGAKTIHYLFDFGDSWDRVIKLENGIATEGLPLLLKAAGRCPPEDVGGAPGYAEYLDGISDPAHPKHEQYTLLEPGAVRSQRRRPEGARGRRQRMSDQWKPRRRPTQPK
ncbi:hypothetical protein ACVIGB_008523 [Bradyrhizobium sp. USDA 4341]